MLPLKYSYLNAETGPKMLLEALKLIGTKEISGAENNPTIMSWAAEVGLAKTYSSDEVPWCGLFIALVAKRAGKTVVNNPLWARNWATFGETAAPAELGDILVFVRKGGGHVGLYVGEDKDCYHVLGGNQSDQVSITRIDKNRCVAVRRQYNNKPENVRRIFVGADGPISQNEQ